MLTAIVWGADAPRSLAVTLASLVPAAIDGALREVAVADTEPQSDVRLVADQAGCRILSSDRPASSAGDCKGRWLLLVRSGDRLPDGWLDAALGHDQQSDRPARFGILRANLSPWRRWIGGGPSAILIPRERVTTGREADWESFTRSVRARRLRVERTPLE